MLDVNEQTFKIAFTFARFWIKIYNLPMNMRNQKFVEHLGNKIGRFVEVDKTNLLIPSKALKI